MSTILGTAALLGLALAASAATAEDAVFDSNGVSIRYVVEGTGEPVVLLHGWMGDATMWGRDVAGNPKLTPPSGFRLIAPDLRGHGKSGKPAEVSRYGLEMAEDVVRLLDHLKIKRAHLVGYSMGAFVAGSVAARHPERVISLVFGGQAPLLEGAPASGSDEVEVFARAVEAGDGLGPYIQYVAPPDKPKPTLEAANAIAKILYGGKEVKAWARAGQSLGALRVAAAALKKGGAPMLFVHGQMESSAVKERVAHARNVLGRSEWVVIEGADHVTTPIKSAFGKAILDFLIAHRESPPTHPTREIRPYWPHHPSPR